MTAAFKVHHRPGAYLFLTLVASLLVVAIARKAVQRAAPHPRQLPPELVKRWSEIESPTPVKEPVGDFLTPHERQLRGEDSLGRRELPGGRLLPGPK
jgi:hypothetical protein